MHLPAGQQRTIESGVAKALGNRLQQSKIGLAVRSRDAANGKLLPSTKNLNATRPPRSRAGWYDPGSAVIKNPLPRATGYLSRQNVHRDRGWFYSFYKLGRRKSCREESTAKRTKSRKRRIWLCSPSASAQLYVLHAATQAFAKKNTRASDPRTSLSYVKSYLMIPYHRSVVNISRIESQPFVVVGRLE